jgi:hypothetical protein
LEPRRTTFSLKKNRFIPVCYIFLWLNWFWYLNRWTVAGSFDFNIPYFLWQNSPGWWWWLISWYVERLCK